MDLASGDLDINISRLVTNNQETTEWKKSSPIKTYSKKTSPSSHNSEGKSRYGRVHKPKLSDDFLSTDKKVSQYLRIEEGNQLQFYKSPVKLKKEKSPYSSPRKKGAKKDVPRWPNGIDLSEPTSSETLPEPTELKLSLDYNSSFDGPSVLNIKKEKEEDEEVVEDENEEFGVGELAWAGISGYPYWPCSVTRDPFENIHKKYKFMGRSKVAKLFIHVRFFGDNGRRSWVPSTLVKQFNGLNNFLAEGNAALVPDVGANAKGRSYSAQCRKNWLAAVSEAESLLASPRPDRVSYFDIMFPPSPTQPIKLESPELSNGAGNSLCNGEVHSENDVSVKKKRGRKRKSAPPVLMEPKKIKLTDSSPNREPNFDNVVIKEEPMSPCPEPPVVPRRGRGRPRKSVPPNFPTSIPPPPSPSPSVKVTRRRSLKVEEESKTDLPVLPNGIKQERKASRRVEVRKSKKELQECPNSSGYSAFYLKHFDKVADENPDLTQTDIEKYLSKMWNDLSETQKAKYKSRIADELDPNANSYVPFKEPLTVSSSTVVIPKSSKKGFSLFNGVKVDKVCQVCLKGGSVLKCRGPCNGLFHLECNGKRRNEGLDELLKISGGADTPRKKKGRPKRSGVTFTTNVEIKEEPIDPPDLELDASCSTPDSAKEELNNGASTSGGFLGFPDDEKASNGSNSSDEKKVEDNKGKKWYCKMCTDNKEEACFVCCKKGDEAIRCSILSCGKMYHMDCLKDWPQTHISQHKMKDVINCPQHVCHTCISDNPSAINGRFMNDKLVRCVKCPASYHHGNYCIPAGTEVLSNTQIICPKHYVPHRKTASHVNAAWCFICTEGGSLICCDCCPNSFHAECLKLVPPEGGYTCEDCETGRYPLFGEVVWVKLGNYRWWPAKILFPQEIPDNIMLLPHCVGEFAVEFFGSHDYYWVNRGRVFLYHEGDTDTCKGLGKSRMENSFAKGVEEAAICFSTYCAERADREASALPTMKPPKYVKIQTNRPYGSVTKIESLQSCSKCDCTPNIPKPCGPDSDCINRLLLVECNPDMCPAGERCTNQNFEKRLYPKLEPFRTKARGWGLRTLVPLRKGDFVIEYVGEMIDAVEYQRRLVKMQKNKDENYYFLVIDKDRMLDAGPKGNLARFMNHSCNPNCETQKWTVKGDTRVGLFALQDIPANTELVFNYNLETVGNSTVQCKCGAPNCAGIIGGKVPKNVVTNEIAKGAKKKAKRKPRNSVGKPKKTSEEICFTCGDGGELLICELNACPKAYHLSCLGLTKHPEGGWLCPWHQCSMCCSQKNVTKCCKCINSYCAEHIDNIKYRKNIGYVCCNHNMSESGDSDWSGGASDMEVPISAKRSSIKKRRESSFASSPHPIVNGHC